VTRYDPALPWGGLGSPCRDRGGCGECLMCGGCEIHDGCLADFRHIAWHARFASPGEELCGAFGVVAGRPGYVCALPCRHAGWHQARGGDGWPASRSEAA